MTENSNQDIQKELRREAVKRNWQLFRQSRLGDWFIYSYFLPLLSFTSTIPIFN